MTSPAVSTPASTFHRPPDLHVFDEAVHGVGGPDGDLGAEAGVVGGVGGWVGGEEGEGGRGGGGVEGFVEVAEAGGGELCGHFGLEGG